MQSDSSKMLSNLWKYNIVAHGTSSHETKEMRWKTPSCGSYYVNSDASIKRNVGTGLGLITRDNKGKVMVAATYFIDAKMEVREVEVYAFRWEIIKVNELGLLGA